MKINRCLPYGTALYLAATFTLPSPLAVAQSDQVEIDTRISSRSPVSRLRRMTG
jgi:hypothetical protein